MHFAPGYIKYERLSSAEPFLDSTVNKFISGQDPFMSVCLSLSLSGNFSAFLRCLIEEEVSCIIIFAFSLIHMISTSRGKKAPN